MLQVYFPIDTIYPKRNKFATDVKIDATGESKLNDSPGSSLIILLSHAFVRVVD